MENLNSGLDLKKFNDPKFAHDVEKGIKERQETRKDFILEQFNILHEEEAVSFIKNIADKRAKVQIEGYYNFNFVLISEKFGGQSWDKYHIVWKDNTNNIHSKVIYKSDELDKSFQILPTSNFSDSLLNLNIKTTQTGFETKNTDGYLSYGKPTSMMSVRPKEIESVETLVINPAELVDN